MKKLYRVEWREKGKFYEGRRFKWAVAVNRAEAVSKVQDWLVRMVEQDDSEFRGCTAIRKDNIVVGTHYQGEPYKFFGFVVDSKRKGVLKDRKWNDFSDTLNCVFDYWDGCMYVK